MAASSLDALVDALRALPGIGVKSAQRIAYHLMQHDRDAGLALARALDDAVRLTRHCSRCHSFSEEPVCSTCLDPERDPRLLAVVETPADQAALERSGGFRGLYFVLLGRFSPLDGIGPREIAASELLDRAAAGEVAEVILALSTTAEGEATSEVLAEALRLRGIRVTRLARGVPAGSELEYVDLSTIAHALHDRH